MQPPILVNEASGYGTGQLPDKEGQMYHDAQDNLYLIPTAEVPITNLYRDEIIAARTAAHQKCRLHALLPPRGRLLGRRCARPQPPAPVRQGRDRADRAARAESTGAGGNGGHIEGLLQKLELPYRVLRLCGGDMGFTSALTYDLEV